MDWCWYSCAYGDCVILTVQSLQTAKQLGKMYLKQNAIFWATRQQRFGSISCYSILACFERQNGTYILFLYNGKDGNSAFVRSGNLCSYFYQYTPIARITGNH